MSAARRGVRTLVISTDPASSLADAFRLTRAHGAPDAPRRVRIGGNVLHVIEIDARRALGRWLASRRAALERIAVRGTWLDDEDVAGLLKLSLPGIDELAALLEIARAGRDGRFDLVIVDTAPTGHALRMLAMPGTLRAVARVFDHMQAKHRMLVDALGRGWTPDAEDRLISELDDEGRELSALLRDPARVAMAWVTLAEPMAVAETVDALVALRAEHITVDRIIVNRVTPAPPSPCGRCSARLAFEARAIVSVRRVTGVSAVVKVGARDREPRDLRSFAAIAREIEHAGRAVAPRKTGEPSWRAPVAPGPPAVAALDARGTRLVMFGGKGGTGKTTCAAAFAVDAAAREPRRRMLLLSTDPAHSLGDVLGRALSDEPGRITGAPANLAVRELDASRALAVMHDRYAAAIDAVFDRLSRGGSLGDAGHDRRVMHDLIDLAPPGIDELAAVLDVTDALDGPGGYDLVVMDTAPTGHALRLLEMPALVQGWAKALMSILLKYQPVVGIGDLGAMLLALSKGLGRLRALLGDAGRARFIIVTRPASLPRAETSRLVARLRAMGIAIPAIVVNAVGRGTCRRCLAAARDERREIAAATRDIRRGGHHDTIIAIAPEVAPPPHGAAALRRWGRSWRAEPARAGRAISSKGT